MKRNRQIFDTLQKQDKRIPESMLDSLSTGEMQESDVTTTETKIRNIVREELGHSNRVEFRDPLFDAMKTIKALKHETKKSSDSMNVKLIREYVKSLNELLPEISEEFEIIRDVISGMHQ